MKQLLTEGWYNAKKITKANEKFRVTTHGKIRFQDMVWIKTRARPTKRKRKNCFMEILELVTFREQDADLFQFVEVDVGR